MTLTLTIDMDKRCSECRKPGATGSGICLACASKAIAGKPMRSPEGQAVQRRFAERRGPNAHALPDERSEDRQEQVVGRELTKGE